MLESLQLDPGEVPLGVGLKRLIGLRRAGALEGYAECPVCGAGNSVLLEPEAFFDIAVPQDMTPMTIEADDLVLTVRPVTAADLAVASRQSTPEAAAALLRRAALLAVDAPERAAPQDAESLPPEAWGAVERALEEADPLADPRLALTCRSCGHGWELALDLPDLLMNELWQSARATLAETAALARAYGWSEQDIAALSPARRRAYLELAQ